MPSTLEATRAEALFVSDLQSSDLPGSDDVRRAVAGTLRQFRIRGCAARVASEFGDHPDTAVRRMAWALATIRAVYLGGSLMPPNSGRLTADLARLGPLAADGDRSRTAQSN
jgi:hypothetical protein